MVNEDPLAERIQELEQWVSSINDRARAAASAAADAADAAAHGDIPDNGMVDPEPAQQAARAAATTQTAIEAEYQILQPAIETLRNRYTEIYRLIADDEMNVDVEYRNRISQLEQDIRDFNTQNVVRIEELLHPEGGQQRGGRRLRKRGQESRRCSSSARKSSSRRGRRSAKKRGTQRKQKRRQHRGSRRAY
jgi:hypothetical protein